MESDQKHLVVWFCMLGVEFFCIYKAIGKAHPCHHIQGIAIFYYWTSVSVGVALAVPVLTASSITGGGVGSNGHFAGGTYLLAASCHSRKK